MCELTKDADKMIYIIYKMYLERTEFILTNTPAIASG